MSEPVAGSAPVPVPAPPPGAAPGRLGSPFWRLWAASVVSNLGDGVGVIAYPWLATQLTRDPVLVAGIGIAQRLPWLLFSLPAGAVVDRVDRRRLMVGANTTRFVLTAGVVAGVLSGVMTLPLLYAAALALGVAEVLYDNAAQTILPALVAPERLERANGTLWGAEMAMNQFVGPPLGGFLIAAGLALPFAFDAGTFAVSAVLLTSIRGGFRARAVGGNSRTTGPAPGAARPSLRSEIAEGLRWLWSHGLLRRLALALGAQNLLFTATTATFVLFVQEILVLDARGFGVLEAAGAVGGVAGSQLAPAVTRRIGPGAALGVALGVPAVALAGIGLTDSPVVVAVLFSLGGFVAVMWNVITVSLRQTIIPDHLLGRVNSAYRMLGWGSMPLGALLGGALVAVGQPLWGREVALRLPFLVAGAAYAALWAAMAPKLTSAAIARARASAAR